MHSNRFTFRWLVLVGAVFLTSTALSLAQVPPRTLESIQEIAPDGSATLTVNMAFDALPWRQWKTFVGEEPSRLRSTMRHQFAAFTIDDFKLERDDLNRTARVTMRSAVGPGLLSDGSFAIPVEKDYRLVSQNTREWFFSGNNPYAANALVTIKVVLPSNVTEAALRNAGTADQTLVYRLPAAAGFTQYFIWSGVVVMVVGLVVVIVGVAAKATPPLAPNPATAS